MDELKLEGAPAGPAVRIATYRAPALDPSAYLAQDYREAEISVLYSRSKANQRKLLFAVVEMLPDWTERLPDRPAKGERAIVPMGKADVEVNLRRFHLPAEQALAWYHALRTGSSQLPWFEGESKAGETHFLIAVDELGEEPAWPSVVLESPEFNFWDSHPLWGERSGQARRHTLVPMKTRYPFAELRPQDAQRFKDDLAREFPLKLFARPVLWGSAHLILPNPLFQDLSMRLAEGDRRTLLLKVTPYPGKRLNDLRLSIRESRPDGPVRLHQFDGFAPLTIVELSDEPHTIAVEVDCPSRGPLYQTPASTFIRNILINADIVVGQRNVSVPGRSARRTEQTYSVNLVHTKASTVGPSPVPSALDVLLKDRTEQQMRRAADELGMQWYNQDIEEATEHIQEIVSAARKALTIVDPYFGMNELLRFAYANPRPDLPIKILTSAEFLKKKVREDAPVTNADELVAQLQGDAAGEAKLNVSVRVMTGERPNVHDRLLVVDERVWLLGSSLNEFAARGTVIVRLPYPAPIVTALDQAWTDGTDLEDWIAQRQAAVTAEAE